MKTLLLIACLCLPCCASIPCPALHNLPGNIPMIKVTLYSHDW